MSALQTVTYILVATTCALILGFVLVGGAAIWIVPIVIVWIVLAAIYFLVRDALYGR